MRISSPTNAQFTVYNYAYDFFNEALFDGLLPGVILNLSRHNKAAGFMAPFRWVPKNLHSNDELVHEISLNPEILHRDYVSVYSTLVHEQVHVWQFTHGHPSRNGYHNREWADKMIEIGLMPSSTGEIGGKQTGQRMSHYVMESGLFLKVAKSMDEGLILPFVSIEGLPMPNTQKPITNPHIPKKYNKKKVKYSCLECKANVWGKSGLELFCLVCEEPFFEIK